MAKARGNRSDMAKWNAILQKQIRKDKEKYLNDQCKELEMYNNKKKPRNTFQKIRELTGNFPPRLGVLKNT